MRRSISFTFHCVLAGVVLGVVACVQGQPYPVITQAPLSQAVVEGSNATFSVIATGNDPLAYRWYFNASPLQDGGRLSGSATPSLMISEVTGEDAGDYSVVVSNKHGSATSSPAMLTVRFPPVILEHPQPVTTGIGLSATFQVGAEGDAPLHYQWDRDGVALFGQTTAVLSIPNVQQADAGLYRATVSNAVGMVTSSVAGLVIVAPPTITSQPQGQTNGVGGFANFSVSATGWAPLVYQWRRDGVPLPGETNTTLSIPVIEATDAGGYTVTIANVGGTTTSSNADLTLLTAPYPYLFNGDFELGNTGFFSDYTHILGGIPSMRQYWIGTRPYLFPHSSGQQWYDTFDHTPAPGVLQMLAIGGTNVDDVVWGTEVVVKTNTAYTFSVWASPAHWENPAVLRCSVNGRQLGADFPLPRNPGGNVWVHYSKWWFSGTSRVARLEIRDLTTQTYGNDFTLDDITFVERQVSAPSITASPQPQALALGAAASFAVQAAGTAPLSYQWLKDGLALPGQTNTTLTVAGVQSADAGQYAVKVSNPAGTVVCSNALLILLPYVPSLLVNGDFEAGNLFVDSDYGYVDGGAPVEGQYAVVHDPSELSSSWFSFGDHTSGSGQLLLGNGGNNPSAAVWRQRVQVQTNHNYAFSAWGRRPFPLWGNFPNLQLFINGEKLGNGIPLYYDPGVWENASVQWNSGTSTVAILEIRDVQTVSIYNDFALDDVVFGDIEFINPAPILQQQPQGISATAGSLTNLTVLLTGLAPMDYQWRFNGVNLPEARSAYLAFENLQSAQAGDYDVVVSNSYGVVTSLVATVTVVPTVPVITEHPASAVVAVGQEWDLRGAVYGTEPMALQWQRGGTNIPGATSSHLKLTNVSFGSREVYRLVASNALGVVVSDEALISVVPIRIWGPNDLPLQNLPASATNLVQLSMCGWAGRYHVLGLRADGTVLGWHPDGTPDYGQSDPPASVTNVVKIEAGADYGLALRADRTVVAWGVTNSTGGPPVPAAATNVIDIAVGETWSAALRGDGTLVTWGFGRIGAPPPAATNLVSLSAGYWAALGVRPDGTIFRWGFGGEVPASATNVVAVAVSPDRRTSEGGQNVAMQSDGNVMAWGNSVEVPAEVTNIAAIAAGDSFGLALNDQGTVFGWGTLAAPADLTNALALAAGTVHGLALLRDPSSPVSPPRVGIQPKGGVVEAGGDFVLRAALVGSIPARYQWHFNSVKVPSMNAPWLSLTNLHPRQGGDYRMVASNAFGSVTSAVATVTVTVPSPALASQGIRSNGFQLSFESLDEVLYITEYRDALTSGQWIELERRIGSGGVEIVTDPDAGAGMRFYHVRAVYAPAPTMQMTMGTSTVGFSVPSVVGVNYVLECKDHIDDAAWQVLMELSGNGGALSFTDPGPLPPSRFYRIRVR